MWYPIGIILNNFKSFEYQEFPFKKGAFLVQGVNKTDEGQQSNGSGKSALREALCYVLDLPLIAESLTDLINDNNGAKSCSVGFSLKNVLSNQELTITRTTPLKGSSTLVIILNGEDQKDKFATVPEGNKLIIELLGVSKEDLTNHYIISKEKYKSFFSSSDKQVKELIGRFSNFNKIDGVEDIVQKDIDKLEYKLHVNENDLSKLEGKVEILQEQLEAEKNIDTSLVKSAMITEFENAIIKHKETIQNNKDNIVISENKIKEYKQQAITEKAVLKVYNEELADLKEVRYDEAIKALNQEKKGVLLEKIKIGDSISELNENLKEFNKFKIEVETTIEGSIKCPKCLHEFILDSELSVEEARKTLPQVLEEIEGINSNLQLQGTQLDELDKSIGKFHEKIQDYDSKITEFGNLKRGIIKKKSSKEDDINDLTTKIKWEETCIVNFLNGIEYTDKYIKEAEKGIEETKAKEITTREKEIQEQIDSLNEEGVVEQEKEIQRIKDDIFDVEQWIIRFKKFKSSLANESLEIIQGYANMYLQKMKTNISLQLEGYKTLKNGDIREKITPIILKNGIQKGTGSLKKFSGGERVRVDIATSVLALQNLINNSSPTGGLNLLFTDEITEGVDGLGLENLAKSISGLDKFCYIISHVQHESVNENILTIEKVNDISKII